MDEDAVDEELRAELLARCAEDQRVRKAAVRKPGHYREIPDDIKEMLRAAVAAGEASPRDLAYLEDRVRVHADKPQLYGTQFIRDDQGLRPQPIEDPEHLDERRASVGLGPFAEYEAQMHRRG